MYPPRHAGVVLCLLLWAVPPAAWPETGAEAANPEATISVIPRQDKLRFYPCAQCHKFLPANHEERALYAPHLKDLPHGNRRFWCLTCHEADDRDRLHLMNGETASFNEAYKVCAQCHSSRAKDWQHGAHGKRVANWRGERVIYSCPQCHNPHDPAIKPIKPDPPPPPRIGFPPPEDHGHPPDVVWEGLVESQHR